MNSCVHEFFIKLLDGRMIRESLSAIRYDLFVILIIVYKLISILYIIFIVRIVYISYYYTCNINILEYIKIQKKLNYLIIILNLILP